MPSNYTVSGQGDLDDIFMPRSSGSAGTTNFKVSSQSFEDRYHAKSGYSEDNIGFNTNYKVGGNDLRNVFMKKHDCYTYQFVYENSGFLQVEYFTCYGAEVFIFDNIGDNFGGVPFGTDCVWEDSVVVYFGDANNLGSCS
jgi:hypothetical protein